MAGSSRTSTSWDSSDAGARLDGVRVLIVDDDAHILEAFEAAMLAEGADVVCVRDGNAAVEMCREDPPDVVVLDMMLPGRSGYFALEKIKGHAHSPQVVMVTANEGKRHQAYAESLGVDAYLVKPVPLATLADTVVRLAERQAEVVGLRTDLEPMDGEEGDDDGEEGDNGIIDDEGDAGG